MSGNIRVCARVRPFLAGEGRDRAALDVQSGSESSIRILSDGEQKYHFTRVWGENSTQDEIFGAVGRPSVDDVLAGFHATIFVYGQTGTGKTHTLGNTTPGNEGIQPRAITYLFERAEQMQGKVVVQAEYVQLYRERMLDLLDPTKERIELRADDVHGTAIEGNTCATVSSEEELKRLIHIGDTNRITANTQLNSSSSRSHSCLILTTSVTPDMPNPPQDQIKQGRLYLIDLAGSERISKSGATGDSYKEAVAINKSLTVLGTCVHGIVNGTQHIPFRDSKLTRLLHHSLTGKGKTTVIITVHPSRANLGETACTLKFGERAMKVQTQMTVGDYQEKATAALLRTAQQQEVYANLQTRYSAEEQQLTEEERIRAEKEEQIKAVELDILVKVGNLRKEMEQSMEVGLSRHVAHSEAQKAKMAEELALLRDQEREQVDAAKLHTTDKRETMQRETDEFKQHFQTILNDLKERGAATSNKEIPPTPDEQPLKDKLAKSRAELADLKHQIRDRTPSEHSGRTLRELKQLTMKLKRHNADLAGKARDLKHIKEDRERQAAFLEAAPSVEDDASDMSRPESSGVVETAMTDFTPPSSPSSGGNEMAREKKTYLTPTQVKEARGKDPLQLTREEEDVLFEHVETRHMKDAVRKEQHFRELLERILQYLEGGTPMWRIAADKHIERSFMYTDRVREQLYVVKENKDGTPNREDYSDIIDLTNIVSVVLGQETAIFKQFHPPDFKPDTSKREERADIEEVVTKDTVKDHFYKSFSLGMKGNISLDVIASVHNDYEAWLTGLHRLKCPPPQFVAPLLIEDFPRFAELDPLQQEVCRKMHLTPEIYLKARRHVFSDSRLFMTLYDMRTMTGLDLWTSHQLFIHFTEDVDYLKKHEVWLVASKKSGMQGPGRRPLSLLY